MDLGREDVGAAGLTENDVRNFDPNTMQGIGGLDQQQTSNQHQPHPLQHPQLNTNSMGGFQGHSGMNFSLAPSGLGCVAGGSVGGGSQSMAMGMLPGFDNSNFAPGPIGDPASGSSQHQHDQQIQQQHNLAFQQFQLQMQQQKIEQQIQQRQNFQQPHQFQQLQGQHSGVLDHSQSGQCPQISAPQEHMQLLLQHHETNQFLLSQHAQNQPSAPLQSQSSLILGNETSHQSGSITDPVMSRTALASSPNRHALSQMETFNSGTVLDGRTWEDKTIDVAHKLLGRSSVSCLSRAAIAAKNWKPTTISAVGKEWQLSEASGSSAISDIDISNGLPAPPRLGDVNSTFKNNIAGNINGMPGEGSNLDAMNPKTAKNIHMELSSGLNICDEMTNTIKSILAEIDLEAESDGEPDDDGLPTSIPAHLASLMNPDPLPSSMTGTISSHQSLASGVGASQMEGESRDASTEADSTEGFNAASKGGTAFSSKGKKAQNSSEPRGRNPNAETVAEGNPKGSTRRKLRKRSSTRASQEMKDEASSIPGKDEIALVDQFEDSGKRKLSKREIAHRTYELARFRTLKQGDYVAAKFASRDLWILARVVCQWTALDISVSDRLSMTEMKKETVYKEKVLVQDVEDYDGDPQKAKAIPRHLIIPLPRTYSEASEWGSRLRRGFRVFAMYPSTTSLYCATVIDSTTWCRGDDDIIVVEFDGDEDDTSKTIPQRHISARFVTMIPRDFPDAQVDKRSRKASNTAQNAGATMQRREPTKSATTMTQIKGESKKNMPQSDTVPSSLKGKGKKDMGSDDDELRHLIGSYIEEDTGHTSGLDGLEEFGFGESNEAGDSSKQQAQKIATKISSKGAKRSTHKKRKSSSSSSTSSLATETPSTSSSSAPTKAAKREKSSSSGSSKKADGLEKSSVSLSSNASGSSHPAISKKGSSKSRRPKKCSNVLGDGLSVPTKSASKKRASSGGDMNTSEKPAKSKRK